MNPTDTLEVWLAGERVATLHQARNGRLHLTYEPEIPARLGIGALCLSAALPVRPTAFVGDQVSWWVEGLLPEGEARTLLEQHFDVRRGDAFGLLRTIGRDCAGAVSFLSTEETPETDSELHLLDDAAVEDAIAELPRHPLGADFDIPVSLAGLQAKLLLCRTPQGWARPGSGHPSTHILKPDPFEKQGLIAAEAFSHTVARLAGIDVANTELVRLADRDVLIVERFDRRVGADGGIERLHQEDGCQALGIDPTGFGKYQQPSRKLPTYEGLAKVLGSHAPVPSDEWTRLATAMTLSIAIGNTDAHARNHTFLFRSQTLELSPLYDMAPTVEFARTERTALWVCGQHLLEKVTSQHLTLEAKAWGLPQPDADAVVIRTLEAVLTALPAAADQIPGVPGKLVDRIDQRIKRLLSRQSAN
jgi:serine/threonine-protein kinase HipA